MSFLEYVKDDPQRWVLYAHEENPSIKDFDEFADAFFKAFNTERGKNASKNFDEDALRFLFESRSNQELMHRNLSDEEFDEIFKQDYEVQRNAPIGEVKRKDIVIVPVERPIKVSGYSRKGRTVASYSRSFKPFTPAQVEFLKVRRTAKVPRRQAIAEYNQHFKEDRTTSSLSSKYYRL